MAEPGPAWAPSSPSRSSPPQAWIPSVTEQTSQAWEHRNLGSFLWWDRVLARNCSPAHTPGSGPL